MKSTSGRAKKDKTTLNKTSKKKLKDNDSKKKRTSSVSALALNNRPVKKISVEKPKRRTSSVSEPYKEKSISGAKLAKWKVMPKASQEEVLKVIDSAISSVIYKVKESDLEAVQTHLNQLKRRITKNIKELKVPPVKDYKKLRENCNVLEDSLADSNYLLEKLDNEIDEIEKSVESKEEELSALESEAQSTEEDDRPVHSFLESPYSNKLSLPPLFF